VALISEAVAGAESISTIPFPTTSPVFMGELPSRCAPVEADMANAAPVADCDDCVATHQWNTYRPGSLNVISPVTLL
jgi:hypothetical protein